MGIRKSLGLLGAASLVSIMALGVIGSGAWFTASANVPVSAAAGHLRLSLSGPAAQKIELKDLNPTIDDWTKSYDVIVKADATMDIKLKVSAAIAGTQTAPALFEKLNVRVYKCGDSPCDFHADWRHPQPQPLYEGKLSTMSMLDDLMHPGDSNCYDFEFQLDETAGNGYQNATATFNIVFTAAQKDAPGWTE